MKKRKKKKLFQKNQTTVNGFGTENNDFAGISLSCLSLYLTESKVDRKFVNFREKHTEYKKK